MKLEQIVLEVQAEQAKALAGLSEAAAAKLLRAAFSVVRKHIAAATDDPVVVPGLGNFKAKLQKKKDAAADAEPVRRVIFVAAKAPAASVAKAASPAREAKRAERQAARKAGKLVGKKKAAGGEAA